MANSTTSTWVSGSSKGHLEAIKSSLVLLSLHGKDQQSPTNTAWLTKTRKHCMAKENQECKYALSLSVGYYLHSFQTSYALSSNCFSKTSDLSKKKKTCKRTQLSFQRNKKFPLQITLYLWLGLHPWMDYKVPEFELNVFFFLVILSVHRMKK